MLCLALVLTQIAFPTRGVALQSGELIEICSEFGVAYLLMDADGNVEEHDTAPCPDCDDCALCALSILAAPIAFGESVEPAFDARRTDRYEPAEVAPNPAQFWAANRGPPLQGNTEMIPCDFRGTAPFRDERTTS